MATTEISSVPSGPLGLGGAGLPEFTEPAEFSPLILELQDELARVHLRESFWMSLVAHLLVAILIVFAPKYLPSRGVPVRTAEEMLQNKDLTFLELPPDAQKNVTPPRDTNTVSDKNRVATSRAPTIDRKTLDELRDARRPGAPGPGGVPAPQAAPQVAQAPPQPGAQGSQAPPGASAQSPPNETARLESPPMARQPFGGGALSAGSAIEQAARATASNRVGGFGGQGGQFGMGPGSPYGQVGPMDILSDTMGVDFGPYLARVLQVVRLNWYALIPEVARPPLMKKGRVSIEFAIMKDGRVAGMRLIGPSGDISLDRAAWGGITASDPFQPLPAEFKGSYLALRFHFFYNPDKNDMQ